MSLVNLSNQLYHRLRYNAMVYGTFTIFEEDHNIRFNAGSGIKFWTGVSKSGAGSIVYYESPQTY